MTSVGILSKLIKVNNIEQAYINYKLSVQQSVALIAPKSWDTSYRKPFGVNCLQFSVSLIRILPFKLQTFYPNSSH